MRKRKKKIKQLAFANFTKMCDSSMLGRSVRLQLCHLHSGLTSDWDILLWKFLRALQFPKLMKKLFGFHPWGWAALQIINYLHKVMNYSVDRVFLSGLLIEDDTTMKNSYHFAFFKRNSQNYK